MDFDLGAWRSGPVLQDQALDQSMSRIPVDHVRKWLSAPPGAAVVDAGGEPRLMVGEQIEQEMATGAQRMADAAEHVLQVDAAQEMVQRIEVRSGQIHGMGKPKITDVLKQEAHVELVASPRGRLEHLGRAVYRKHGDTPAAAQVPSKQSGPASKVGRGLEADTETRNERFENPPSAEEA